MGDPEVSKNATDDSLSINSDDIVIPTRIADYSSPTQPSRRGFLTKLTEDVAELLRPTPTQSSIERADLELAQQFTEIERMAQKMTKSLSKYTELLVEIRSHTLSALNVSLPLDFEMIQNMDQVYLKINRLEEIIMEAAHSADLLETAVNLAEAELMPSTKASIKNFFRTLSPFSLPSSKEPSEWALANFEEPDKLFCAEKYFPEEE